MSTEAESKYTLKLLNPKPDFTKPHISIRNLDSLRTAERAVTKMEARNRLLHPTNC